MIPPIPIPFTGQTADALQTLAWAFQTALTEDCRKLLGKPVSLARPTVELFPAEGFFEASPKHFACVEGELSGPLTGPLFLVMELRTAVTMSALLLMTPADQIEARRSQPELTEAELDALEEIGNVLCGALNRILQKEAGKAWHLKKRQVLISGTPPPGEYVTLTWPLRIESYDEKWYVLIPLALGETLAGEIRKAKREEREAQAPSGGKKPVEIAIIEGDEADGRRLCQLLEEEGFAATLFLKPGELLQPVKASLPQLIILGVDSQPEWGVMVVRRLALDERTRGIPVIATSEAPTVEMVVALVRSGVKALLAKPYRKETLLERLKALGFGKTG